MCEAEWINSESCKNLLDSDCYVSKNPAKSAESNLVVKRNCDREALMVGRMATLTDHNITKFA
jgi:hypothetical protein